MTSKTIKALLIEDETDMELVGELAMVLVMAGYAVLVGEAAETWVHRLPTGEFGEDLFRLSSITIFQREGVTRDEK